MKIEGRKLSGSHCAVSYNIYQLNTCIFLCRETSEAAAEVEATTEEQPQPSHDTEVNVEEKKEVSADET